MADLFQTTVSNIMARIRALEAVQQGFTYHSQILNGGFEKWALGAGPFTTTNAVTADSWIMQFGTGNTMSVTKDTTNFDALASATCAKIVTTGSHLSVLKQDLTGPFVGTPIAVSMRVRANVAHAVHPRIGTTIHGTFHSGDDTYQTLTVTGVWTSAPVTIFLAIQATDPVTVYVDNVMVVQGVAPIDYVYDSLRG